MGGYLKSISRVRFDRIRHMTQKEALDILKTGRNVFLTGSAGSGKTHVLREYIKFLNEIGVNIGVTASTGIAGTHMGGMTIHSWAGIGIKDYLTKGEISEIAEKQNIKSRIKKVSVLIIDEISMLHHFRLDLVDSILKEVKNTDKPFGGIQVVFSGDFFQLPPVKRVGEREALFAYHSESWKSLDLKICYLEEQYRQNDDDYLKILNSIRKGVVPKEMRDILYQRFEFDEKDIDQSTKLYTHNINVDRENEENLRQISGKVFEYKMLERGRGHLVDVLKKGCLAPEILKLKVGARVMFVKNNFEAGFVNGTLGKVADLREGTIKVRTNDGKTIDVEMESWRIEEDGKTKAEIKQYPLRLAWAITIHKSQGMSLDSALIDLSKSFEKGMGYVALSRVRSLNGLYLTGLNEVALQINEEILHFDQNLKKLSDRNAFHIRTMGEEKIEKLHKDFKKIVGGKSKKEEKIDTLTQTKNMILEGKNLKEISKERGLKLGTILDHLEKIKQEDPRFNIYNLRSTLPNTKFKNIYFAFKKIGLSDDGYYKLSPVKDLLGPKYNFEDLRLVRLFL